MIRKTLLFLLLPVFCHSQDTNTYSSQVIASITNSNDAIEHIGSRFIVFAGGGVNSPERNYGVSTLYDDGYGPQVYGYSLGGYQFNAMGVYMFSSNAGLVVKFGNDVNYAAKAYNAVNAPNNVAYQYMGGLYIQVNPKSAIVNFSFNILMGEATVNVLNSDNFYFDDALNIGPNTSGYEIPGKGSGFALYIGTDISCKVYKQFYFTISGGYFSSYINFPNGMATNYSGIPNNNGTVTYSSTVSKEAMNMTMGILELNFGIGMQF